MIHRHRFSRPCVFEGRSPLRELSGRRTPPPEPSVRAVLLADFLDAWQRCLRAEGLYTLLLPEQIPEIAIAVDERELAYLLTQYGAVLTRMHKTRQLRSSAAGSTRLLAMLRLAVLRAETAVVTASLLERRRLLESSLRYLGIRLAHDETALEVGAICMIQTDRAIGLRELCEIDRAGIARAVTDAVREIRAYLE